MSIDTIARGLAAKASTQTLRKLAVALDPTLGWDSTTYNLGTITLRFDATGRAIGDCAIRPRDFFAAYKAGTMPVLYVSTTGNDTTGTGAVGTPYASINKAHQVINASGTASVVRVLAGTYTRSQGTSGNATPLTVSGCVLEASGGRVVLGTHDALTWSANATYAWVYQATRSTAGSAVFLDKKRDNGLYDEPRLVGSLAEVSRNPGSWYSDGTTVYVYHHVGAAVTNTNTRVYLAVPNLRLTGTTQLSWLMTGQSGGDGFDVEGGTPIYAGYTGGAGATKVVIGLEHATFRYGGSYALSVNYNAAAFDSVNGLVFAWDCDASAGWSDNWNFHNVLGAAMYVLTLNCTARDAGRKDSTSCNLHTGHETVIGLDIAGGYDGPSRGRSVHWIGASKVQLIGTRIAGSLGDRMQGGTFDPCELSAGNTTVMSGDYVQLAPLVAGGSAALAAETSTITLRNTFPFRGQASAVTGATVSVKLAS